MLITLESIKDYPKGFNVGDYILILTGASRSLNRIVEVRGHGVDVVCLVDGEMRRKFYGVNGIFSHLQGAGSWKPLISLSVEDFSICF